MILTEHRFELPLGYAAEDGMLCKTGTMRLATAGDEIKSMNDVRVKANEAYIVFILLSRVVTLDVIGKLNTNMLENFFAKDIAFLQRKYNELNREAQKVSATCPKCSHTFELEVETQGEL